MIPTHLLIPYLISSKHNKDLDLVGHLYVVVIPLICILPFTKTELFFAECVEQDQTVNESPIHTINPLTDDKILDWSKWKQIADDIVKCI